ncbi:MAG TPA: M20 family peptidase [Thermoanaerobaculia bacterium]|jgi:carboxypeptidase PM20D1
MKRITAIVLALVALVVAILIVRAATLRSRQITASPAPPLAIDRNAALARFSRAVQFQTVSYGEVKSAKPVEHEAFIAWLAQAYPRVHASLQREVIGRSLLFTWRGSDPSLAPLLLMGHYDVVPVEPGTESKWQRPPFSGAVADGFVWGRGTLDDKVSVIGLLESAESLLSEGFAPKRTILFAFGEDEELGGVRGAARISALLASRGVHLDFVVDEGGAILRDPPGGVPKPAALIGIAEKGMASLELTARGAGGHSSMPPPRTEVGAVAAAVDRVQTHPFDAAARGAAAEMFRWLAPEMPFGNRLVIANLWLFAPLLQAQARSSPSLNALLRTTIAPTIIEGGVKDNVIPSHARAVVNFRILPGESVAGVLRHVREVVGDPHVEVRVYGKPWEPSGVSDPNAAPFRAMQQAAAEVFPNTVVAPYLVIGATDSRYFASLTPNVYRLVPVTIAQADLERIHGTNERVAVEAYFDTIRFFRQLMKNRAA